MNDRVSKTLKQIRLELDKSPEEFAPFSQAITKSIDDYKHINALVLQFGFPDKSKQLHSKWVKSHNQQLTELKSFQERYKSHFRLLEKNCRPEATSDFPVDVLTFREAQKTFFHSLEVIIAAYGTQRKAKRGPSPISMDLRYYIAQCIVCLDVYLEITPKNKKFKDILFKCLSMVDPAYTKSEQNLPRLIRNLNSERVLLHIRKLYSQAKMPKRCEIMTAYICRKK